MEITFYTFPLMRKRTRTSW